MSLLGAVYDMTIEHQKAANLSLDPIGIQIDIDSGSSSC
jgi:hypothetical protein